MSETRDEEFGRIEEATERWQSKVEPTAKRLYNACIETSQSADAVPTYAEKDGTLKDATARSAEVLSYHEIAVAVQALVDVATGISMLSWERTEPCPYCDGTCLGRMMVGTEKVNHYENGPSKSKGMHPSTEVLGYHCYDCDQMIKISPKGLLTDLCEWELDDHPTLSAALKASCNQKRTDEDWSRGDECTFCTRRDTRESNIYVEPMTPLGDDVVFHADTEVIAQESVACDGCGETLHADPLSELSFVF